MDRVFEQNYIKNLCEDLKQAIRELEERMDAVENVANEAISAMNQVPADVMNTSIETAANALKQSLADIDVERLKKAINECETRATVMIPGVDSKYAERFKELENTINNIKEASAEVREFLKTNPLTMSNSDFAVAYEAMHAKCNSYLEDANAQMDKILANIKGAEKISTVFSKDPVNLSTGNFIYDRTDLETGGANPFKFSRFYNSINHRRGVLGKDWNHNYEVHIFKENNELVLIREEGKEERFIKTSTGEPASVYHTGGTLTETEEGYLYETREQVKYYFDKEGYYLKQETLDGITTMLYYEECGTSRRLLRVERPEGEHFVLKYDEAGYLLAVTDHAGRQISYKVEKDLLRAVSTPMGYWMNYEYTPTGKLKGVTNPRGIKTVENEFDSKMRTTLQKFPDGSQMSYAYDDEKREVELTERNGSKITYVHDAQFRDIRHIYSDGEERFEYNKLNQKTLVVDKLGNKTQFGYDSKGNLTRIINALGVKTDIQYNGDGKIVWAAINGVEKIRNRYDEKGNIVETRDGLGNTYRLEYEKYDKPTKLIQPDGSELRITYDSRGNITSLINANGAVSKFVYDELNQVIESKDANGNVTKFEYDVNGNITKVINAVGDIRVYEYNEDNKVTKIVDFDGSLVYREYNELNQLSKVTDQLGRETRFTYDAMWNVARIILPDGCKTTYIYDEHNRLGRIRNVNGSVLRYTYDKVGNRIAAVDEDGNKMLFAYDALKRLTSVTGADGTQVFYDYDAEGHITKISNNEGDFVNMSYDANGNLVKETNHMGESRSYTYTKLGNIETITEENGLLTQYLYFPGGQLKEINYPDGTKESFEYDANGNIKGHTDIKGYHISYEYNSLNQIVAVCGSDGARKEYRYDKVGNITDIVDGLGNEMSYEYSPTGKLVKVTDADGNITEYEYDVRDQVTAIIQHGEMKKKANNDETQCHITRFERNFMGQITKVTDPLGHIETYAYDKKGRLAEMVDKEGYLTRYGYDARGDVNYIQYADGREVKLSYDTLRQLKEVEDWIGVTKLERNKNENTMKIIAPGGDTISYAYTALGQKKEMVYADGTKVEYEYDKYGRLERLIQNDNSILYGYDEYGFLNRKTYPNGVKTTYNYNQRGQIESLAHADAKGIIEQYIYGYDILGNKTSVEKTRCGLEEENGVYTYAYDSLGRLETVAKDGTTLRTYKYDAFGNRVGLMENGYSTQYHYNASNQLIRKNDECGETTYEYDKRGNLCRVLEAGTLKNEYVYGAINRLEKANNNQGESACYIYNGLGHRVAKEEHLGINPAKKIDYILDLTRDYNNLLQKRENGQMQSYIWDYNVVGLLDSENTCEKYYLQDELGSTIRLIDSMGNLREGYSYDEFGRNATDSQLTAQPFGYTGYQYDRIAGTYFAQAREYRTDVARFDAEDLIKGNMAVPYTMNQYGYCWNNPMNFVDSNGAWPTPEEIRAWIIAELQLMAVTTAVCVHKVQRNVNEIRNNIARGTQDLIRSAGQGFEEFKVWGGNMLEGAGNTIMNGLDNTGKFIRKTYNDAVNVISEFVTNDVIGIDTLIFKEELNENTTYKVTSHSGGSIFVVERDNMMKISGWSINASASIGNSGWSASMSGKNTDPTTWSFSLNWSQVLEGGLKVHRGIYMDKDGIGYQFGNSGTSGNLPLELPDGIIIEDYASISWKLNTKIQYMNWTQLFEGATVLAAFGLGIYVAGNDFTGVGVTDDALLGPIGGYILSKEPWLYNWFEQMIPSLQPCYR